MILKVIIVGAIIIRMVYLTCRNFILAQKVTDLSLELKIKDSHIKQQNKKIDSALTEAEDLEKELEALYGTPRKNPNNQRSEILLLRSRWMTMEEIWKRVGLSKSTVSKYLRIWDSEQRWNLKYPRPVMPKNKSLFQN